MKKKNKQTTFVLHFPFPALSALHPKFHIENDAFINQECTFLFLNPWQPFIGFDMMVPSHYESKKCPNHIPLSTESTKHPTPRKRLKIAVSFTFLIHQELVKVKKIYIYIFSVLHIQNQTHLAAYLFLHTFFHPKKKSYWTKRNFIKQ